MTPFSGSTDSKFSHLGSKISPGHTGLTILSSEKGECRQTWFLSLRSVIEQESNSNIVLGWELIVSKRSIGKELERHAGSVSWEPPEVLISSRQVHQAEKREECCVRTELNRQLRA